MSDNQNDMKSLCDVLEQLEKLKDSGIISEEEFLAKKADILERLSVLINPNYITEQNSLAAEQERMEKEKAMEEQLAEKRKYEVEQKEKEAEAYDVFWKNHASEREALIAKRADAVQKISELGAAAKVEREELERFVKAVDFELNKSRVEDDTKVSDKYTVRIKIPSPTEAATAKKKTRAILKVIGAAVVVIALALGYVKAIKPAISYNNAIKLAESGEYEAALEKLEALGNYPAAQGKILEVMLEYAEELLAEEDYLTALDYLKKCGEYERAPELINETAHSLLEEQKYDAAIEYCLCLYENDAESMKPIYYDYLNWQLDNHDYTDTAETYDKIKDYKDVSTNKKFSGAKLISAGKLANSNTEFHGLSSATMLNFTFEFSADGTLKFNTYGAEISLITTEIEVKVNNDSVWEYRFEGNKVFLKDEENTNGKFLEVGQIVKFNAAKGDEKPSVKLTLDLPGSMSFTKTDFEYDG